MKKRQNSKSGALWPGVQRTGFEALVLTLLLLASSGLQAATRSSANYSISADTLDGGGQAAASANFSSVASVEPAPIGTSASSGYQVQHGFITVKAVNGLPVFVLGGDVTVNEDSGAYSATQATGIDDGDPEVTQTLTFNVSNSNNGLFSAQPALAADGTLTFTPAPNSNGVAQVTVSLTDDNTAGSPALTTADQTFSITVKPVNNPPVFTLGGDVTVAQDSGPYSATQATGIDDGDPEVTQILTFNVSNNNNSLFSVQPAIASDGTLTFTPAAQAVGSALVTVSLTDDNTAGGPALTTTDQTFTITLRDTTPPVITLLGEASVTNEAGTPYLDAGATAIDNVDGDLTSAIVTVNPVQASTPGTYTVTYNVTDAAGNAATQVTRTVTVVDTTPPKFATFPNDAILYCGSDVSPSITGEPTTTDNATGEVSLTHEDTQQGTCPTLIQRTWTATDASGNQATKVQAIHLAPHTLVTDASNCVFDLDPTTAVPDFHLVFTLDPTSLSTYILQTSNPGQFNYHVLYLGTPGQEVNLALRLPYPFVTRGNTPLTVYDGVAVTFNALGAACLVPGTVSSSAATTLTLADYGESAQFQLDVALTVPSSGVADVVVALEYGLKQTSGYGSDASGDAIDPGSGQVLIPNQATYAFGATTPEGDFADSVESLNEFKTNPGVAGLVQWMPDEVPAVGLTVQLRDAAGTVVSQGITDEDGFYQIVYKNQGRPATYTVGIVGDPVSPVDVVLKGNALVEVDFDLPPPTQ